MIGEGIPPGSEVGMNGLELCPACGVPLIVSRNLYWDSNGVIIVKASPRNRFVFFESDTIDHLLAGIEEMIGLPIEHIVLESRSREARRYIERSFPPEMCEPIREYVSKKTAGERTVSTLETLEGEAHVKELAVMISGPRYTDTALNAAGELMQKAGDWKKKATS